MVAIRSDMSTILLTMPAMMADDAGDFSEVFLMGFKAGNTLQTVIYQF